MDEFNNVTLKDLMIMGAWLLTIIGWGVTSSQASDRERRKETRTEVDACCTMIAKLLEKVKKYYLTDADDLANKSLGAEIKFDLKRLILRAERIELKHNKFRVIVACGDYLDSVTGEDFETKSRPLYSLDSDRIITIEMATHELMEKFERGFNLTFK